MSDIGEAIYGHDGSYKMRVCGYKNEVDITKLINMTGIGRNDGSNLIVSLGGKDNSIVSLFESRPDTETKSVPYCHLAYFPSSLENLHNIKQIVFYSFLDHDSCLNLLSRTDTEFAKTRENAYKIVDLSDEDCLLEISKDLLKQLVLYILCKTWGGYSGFLKIAVPGNVDYQLYCKKAIFTILWNMPVFFRKSISFATNITEQKINEYCISFVSEDNADNQTIRLDSDNDPAILQDGQKMTVVLKDFIQLCVDNHKIIEDCYINMELVIQNEGKKIKPDFYKWYYSTIQNRINRINYSTLKTINDSLIDNSLSNWQIRLLKSIVEEKVTNLPNLEQFINDDLNIHQPINYNDTLETLQSYKQIFDIVCDNQQFLSEELIQRLMPQIADEENKLRQNMLVLKQNKDLFSEFFGNQYVRYTLDYIEKRITYHEQKRFISNILQTSNTEGSLKDIKNTISRKSDAWRAEFYPELMKAFFDLCKNTNVEFKYVNVFYCIFYSECNNSYVAGIEDLLYSIYEKELLKQVNEYLLKKNDLSGCIEEVCKTIRTLFPSKYVLFTANLTHEITSVLHQESDNYRSIIDYNVSGIIRILQNTGIDAAELIEWYNKWYNCLIEQTLPDLEKRLDDQPDCEIIKEIDTIYKAQYKLDLEKYKMFVIRVYESVSMLYKHEMINTSFKGEVIFTQQCANAIELKNTVLSLNDAHHSPQYYDFISDYDKYIGKVLYRYLCSSFSTETFLKISTYFSELYNIPEFSKRIYELIQSKVTDSSISTENIEKVYDFIYQYWSDTEYVSNWEKNNWLKRRPDYYGDGEQKTNSFNEYFRQSKSFHLSEMPSSYKFWSRFSSIGIIASKLKNKYYDDKDIMYFEDFISAMEFGEQTDVSFEKFLSGDSKSVSYYTKHFRFANNGLDRGKGSKRVAIKMKKYRNTYDFYFEVYLYNEFMIRINEVKEILFVDFFNNREKRCFSFDTVLESITIIDNIKYNYRNDKNKKISIQTVECLNFLLPYFELKPNNIKKFFSSQGIDEYIVPDYKKGNVIRVLSKAFVILLALLISFMLGMICAVNTGSENDIQDNPTVKNSQSSTQSSNKESKSEDDKQDSHISEDSLSSNWSEEEKNNEIAESSITEKNTSFEEAENQSSDEENENDFKESSNQYESEEESSALEERQQSSDEDIEDYSEETSNQYKAEEESSVLESERPSRDEDIEEYFEEPSDQYEI